MSTLQKWSNKVLAIAPSALLPSNQTKFSFSAKNKNEVKSAVALIEDALLDRAKLVERTKVWRGKGTRLGATSGARDESNPGQTDVTSNKTDADASTEDIFDETDFYQSLLRDVIASRATDASIDGGLGDLDWRAAQRDKKRAKTASGAVDTRASKGRKLRFEVHEKLRNFMPPAPPPSLPQTAGMGAGVGGGGAVWHEAQVDELFASLLGRGFGGERDVEDGGEAAGKPGMDVDVEAALKGGFRVFG